MVKMLQEDKIADVFLSIVSANQRNPYKPSFSPFSFLAWFSPFGGLERSDSSNAKLRNYVLFPAQ